MVNNEIVCMDKENKDVHNVNYMHIIEPEFYIHVGIKDDKVISIGWVDLIKNYPDFSNIEMKAKVIKYLRQAVDIMVGQGNLDV